MSRLLSNWGLIAGLGLVLLTDAVILAGVAWNRSGEPDAVLELTETELRIRGGRTRENTGLSLELVSPRAPLSGSRARDVESNPCQSPDWLDREKLAELGFDVSVPPTDAEAPRFYSQIPSREVTLVLTVGGEDWRRWAESFEPEPEAAGDETGEDPSPVRPQERSIYWESIERALREGSRSRLWVVDAGTDPEVLRRLYPDRKRYALVPGQVGIFLRQRRPQPSYLEAMIQKPLVGRIHVPFHLRPVLDEVLREDRAFRLGEVPRPRAPRYRAELAFGKRHEPWLLSVERLESPEPVTREDQAVEGSGETR